MGVDLTALAQTIKGQQANTSSLIPSVQASTGDLTDLLPSRPTYTPYRRQKFDSTVKGGPGSDLGWTWEKGIKSQQLWDSEQDQKANDVLQKYNLDLGAWQDALKIAQYNDEKKTASAAAAFKATNDYLASQGLNPLAYMGDPSAQINQLGQTWKSAMAKGDTVAADAAHQAAIALAQQAGWLQPGQTVDSVSSMTDMTHAGSPTYEKTYNDTKYADAMKQQEFENDLALQKLALERSNSNASSSNTAATKASKEMADGIIADMQNEALYLQKNGVLTTDPNYAGYVSNVINDAQQNGAWDYINAADKARILTLAASIGKQSQ